MRQGFEALGRHVRYTLRTMRRDALWTIQAAVILGLGVGASSTVFDGGSNAALLALAAAVGLLMAIVCAISHAC